MKHLFVALAKEPWGELVLGLRVAAELAARGDDVVILAPRGHHLLLAGVPHQIEYFDDSQPFDARVLLPQAVARCAADTVILVDLTIVFLHLKQIRADADFLHRLAVPVLALDIWNAPAGARTLDYGETGFITSRHALSVTRRLVPVPIVAPDADPGCYNALPTTVPVSSAERAEARAALGLDDARLVLTTTATWQLANKQTGNPTTLRSALRFPELVAGMLGELGPRVHVVHVGPEPTASYSQVLGDRYQHRRTMAQPEFRRTLAAADLFLTFNLAATSIASAITAGIPVLVGVNSYEGTAEQVRHRLSDVSARVSAWLDTAAPIHRFRAWPYGYYDLMSTLVVDNPYTTAIRVVESLEETRLVDACNELLFDTQAIDVARTTQAAYRETVSRLPSAADRIAGLLR